jgi:hypothetical protein
MSHLRLQAMVPGYNFNTPQKTKNPQQQINQLTNYTATKKVSVAKEVQTMEESKRESTF